MKSRSSTFLVIEAFIAIALFASIFVVDWFYQVGALAKGDALGFSVILMFAAATAFIVLLLHLIVVGFRMKYPEQANG